MVLARMAPSYSIGHPEPLLAHPSNTTSVVWMAHFNSPKLYDILQGHAFLGNGMIILVLRLQRMGIVESTSSCRLLGALSSTLFLHQFHFGM